MPASTVTQNARFLDSRTVVFGHTTGTPNRLAELYKLRQEVEDAIERELVDQQRLEGREVLEAIATAYVVDVEQLPSRARNAHLAEARHVAFWILHRRQSWSLQAIGDWLDRDHSSVLHGVRRVDADSRLRELAAQLHAAARAAGVRRAPQEAA